MRLVNNGDPLATSVLVLNRGYMAVHVVGLRRAFCLVYRSLAEIIDVEDGQYANYDFASWLEMSELRAAEKQDDQDWIRSVQYDIQAPRVVRLLSYDRVPQRSLRFNRRNLLARDGHRCQYCQRRLPPSQLSLDHVLPRSRGGETSWDNIVCSCKSCNTKKGDRTPKEARMQLRREPAKPRFNPLLAMKLVNPKYESWRGFLKGMDAQLDVG